MKTLFTTIILALFTMDCTSQSKQDKDDELIISRTTEMRDQLIKGDFDNMTEYFNDRMLEALKPAQIKDVWDGLIKQVGAYQENGDVLTDQIQGYRVCYAIMKFEDSPFKLKVVFDDKDLVAGLFIVPVNVK